MINSNEENNQKKLNQRQLNAQTNPHSCMRAWKENKQTHTHWPWVTLKTCPVASSSRWSLRSARSSNMWSQLSHMHSNTTSGLLGSGRSADEGSWDAYIWWVTCSHFAASIFICYGAMSQENIMAHILKRVRFKSWLFSKDTEKIHRVFMGDFASKLSGELSAGFYIYDQWVYISRALYSPHSLSSRHFIQLSKASPTPPLPQLSSLTLSTSQGLPAAF